MWEHLKKLAAQMLSTNTIGNFESTDYRLRQKPVAFNDVDSPQQQDNFFSATRRSEVMYVIG